LEKAASLIQQGKLDEARAELQGELRRLAIEKRDDIPTSLLTDLLEIAVLVQDREAAAMLAAKLHGIVGVNSTGTLSNAARMPLSQSISVP